MSGSFRVTAEPAGAGADADSHVIDVEGTPSPKKQPPAGPKVGFAEEADGAERVDAAAGDDAEAPRGFLRVRKRDGTAMRLNVGSTPADGEAKGRPRLARLAGAVIQTTKVTAKLAKKQATVGHRHAALPARVVHPSVIAAVARTPTDLDDRTCFEACRDWILSWLTVRLFSFSTLLALLNMLGIVAFGAMYFFLMIGAHSMCTPVTDCQPRNTWLNISIQVMTALFTYGSVITTPWRVANFHHLTCSKRGHGVGEDFYGRPTDAIWFHIHPADRLRIVVLLLGNTVFQLLNQAFYLVYRTYDERRSFPANMLTLVFFLLALVSGVGGMIYTLIIEHNLWLNEPDRFPPGPIHQIKLIYRKWWRGTWHIMPTGNEYRQRTSTVENYADYVWDREIQHKGIRGNIVKGATLFGEMPWLLHDVVTMGRKGHHYNEPDNPTEGPTIRIEKAGVAPAANFDLYIAVSVSVDGSTRFEYLGRTKAIRGPTPAWCERIHLGAAAGEWGDKAKLKLLLLEEYKLGYAKSHGFVGSVIVSVSDLQKLNAGKSELLMNDIDGDPILSGVPLTPCFVRVSLDATEMNSSHASARPATPGGTPSTPGLMEATRGRVAVNTPSDEVTSDVEGMSPLGPNGDASQESRAAEFPKHVFIMSRGTRGDVQPFVALARGLCNELGWLVTICTEERWKDFVVSKCSDITNGAVRFLCSGGDTQKQTESWISTEIMSSKAELLQEVMMAASESNFFASCPIFMYHLQSMQRKGVPCDLIISAFTLTGVSLLCGEACGIPVAGFCLQPTCIPSDDPGWYAIVPVDSGGLSLNQHGEKLFTSHAALKPMRRIFNEFAFSSLSIPSLRKQYGLAYSRTWKAAFKHRVPIVIPMLPDAFSRPSDWPSSFASTDFIFLRSSAPGGGTLETPIADFIAAARAKGRKLMVMTFSSMPVGRAAALAAIVEMLSKSKHDFALIYVGKRQKDQVPGAVSAAASALEAQGKLLEAERADFGLLFREMDAFVVHGGLGTTVEALRMRKPTAVTGILLMDQRFWGLVCYEKGVGPKPMHIEAWKSIAVDWADRALDPESDYSKAAAALDFGDEANDGVSQNVAAFRDILNDPALAPPKGEYEAAAHPRSTAETDHSTKGRSHKSRGWKSRATRATRATRAYPKVA